MNDEWSFCNNWLRHQSKLERKSRSTLIFCTLEQSELESVLDSIRRFEDLTNSGKEQIAVMRKLDRSAGTIELFVEGSKVIS